MSWSSVSFRSGHATLEEVTQADLLFHVVDAASREALSQIEAVQGVLKEVKCDGKPTVVVLNKVDAAADPIEFQLLKNRFPRAVPISASRRRRARAARRRGGLCVICGRARGCGELRPPALLRCFSKIPLTSGPPLATL